MSTPIPPILILLRKKLDRKVREHQLSSTQTLWNMSQEKWNILLQTFQKLGRQKSVMLVGILMSQRFEQYQFFLLIFLIIYLPIMSILYKKMF